MNNSGIFLAVLIMALLNFFIRAIPFIFFRKRKAPKLILFIANYFPAIIISILIVFTLKDIDFKTMPYGLIELLSIIFIIILHLLFKNYLVSIFLGTIFYMVIVQFFK